MSIAKVKSRLENIKTNGCRGIPFSQTSISDRHDSLNYVLNTNDYQKSHSAYTWNTVEHLCGCESDKGYLRYRPFGFIHFLPRNNRCVVGNMCWCINLKTMELRRHRIGDCPDGKYDWKDQNK